MQEYVLYFIFKYIRELINIINICSNVICSPTIIAIFFNHKLLTVQDLIDHAFEMRDMRIHIRYHSFQRHNFLVIARRIIMHFLITYSRINVVQYCYHRRFCFVSI